MSAAASSRLSIPGDVEVLAHRYERLRTFVLEGRRAPCSQGGLAVLLRQGMIAWMQLCAAECRVEPSRRARAAALPAPVRSELLIALTELVLQTSCGRS